MNWYTNQLTFIPGKVFRPLFCGRFLCHESATQCSERSTGTAFSTSFPTASSTTPWKVTHLWDHWHVRFHLYLIYSYMNLNLSKYE